jgi:hypothetical protein
MYRGVAQQYRTAYISCSDHSFNIFTYFGVANKSHSENRMEFRCCSTTSRRKCESPGTNVPHLIPVHEFGCSSCFLVCTARKGVLVQISTSRKYLTSQPQVEPKTQCDSSYRMCKYLSDSRPLREQGLLAGSLAAQMVGPATQLIVYFHLRT